MPVRISQVAARANRLIGPYRAMRRSRSSKLLARFPRSLNSHRIHLNTHLVIVTGSALGTTRVMIADSTVVATISAPPTKASTASTFPTASVPPLAGLVLAATGRRQDPGRLPGPLPRHPDPVPANAGQAHQPVQQPPPPLRTVRVGLAAGRDAGLGQHRPNPGSELGGPEIPQSPPRGPRRHPRPRVHPGIIPPTRLGRRPGLPTMFPSQAPSLGNLEASPSLVYGARLLSGFGVHPPSCVRIALPPLCAASSTDRAPDYGSGGWGFESLAARTNLQVRPHVAGLGCPYGWGPVNDLPDSRPGRVALPPRCVHLDHRLGETGTPTCDGSRPAVRGQGLMSSG